MTSQNGNMVEDSAKFGATLTFVVEHLSEFWESRTKYSDSCYVCNLPWRMLVRKLKRQINEKSESCLGVFLECSGSPEDIDWSFDVAAEFKILPQKEGIKPISFKAEKCFLSKPTGKSSWGIVPFMIWTDLIDPVKGYITNDSIILAVHFSVKDLEQVSKNSINSKHTSNGHIIETATANLSDYEDEALFIRSEVERNFESAEEGNKAGKDDVDPYVQFFSDPCQIDEIRDLADSVTLEDLGYNLFNQKFILKRLVQIARQQEISPERFYQDMKVLITSDQQFKNLCMSSL